MRKYAFLKEPLQRGESRTVKIMLYDAEEGIYLFEYDRPDAQQCTDDLCYGSPEELYGEWNPLIGENGWTDIPDPLPGCQHDAFLPLRVKGRETGSPEWGKYEILQDGKWVDYVPDTAFIWDLDGTVLDSYKVIVPDLYDAFKDYPGTPGMEEIARLVITHDVATSIRKAAEAAGIPFEEMKARYDGISGKRNHEIRLIPGARKALETLAAGGARHFVVTHRGSSSEDVLKRLGIYDIFEEVVTGRHGFPRKPAPDAVNYLVEKYGLNREHSWYVGDRTIDTDCAANAGIKGILYLPAGSPCVPNGRETLTVQALPDIAEKCLPH